MICCVYENGNKGQDFPRVTKQFITVIQLTCKLMSATNNTLLDTENELEYQIAIHFSLINFILKKTFNY